MRHETRKRSVICFSFAKEYGSRMKRQLISSSDVVGNFTHSPTNSPSLYFPRLVMKASNGQSWSYSYAMQFPPDFIIQPTTSEELQKVFERIGIGSKDDFGNPYEEWFISDYDCYVDGLYEKSDQHCFLLPDRFHTYPGYQ